MRIRSVKLVCFSPTGTSRAVAEAMVSGLGDVPVERFDATIPSAREKTLTIAGDELLVVAAPVYMGRMPDLMTSWLNTVEGRGGPAVAIVVYGNRAYENALIELTDTLEARGLVPIAGAAFIGEHSFASAEFPVALGRPNADDLSLARNLGASVAGKLAAASDVAAAAAPAIPGVRPYGGRTEIWDVDFILVGSACANCGTCVAACPTGAIDAADPARIDTVKCVTCCACVKVCPQGARTIKPGPVDEARKRLFGLCAEPKQPECFV